ncbi:hypothetical protein [Halobellus marinus]|uniref:hypothetical protein n=1 Tax=Halobellus marinus TaxID=3075123 RepID=UPI0028ACF0CA|nr:hypothetical protein [Halobellus sp. DFY28]
MSADRPGAGYRFVPFVRSGFRPDETFDEDRPASDPLTGPVTFGVSLTVEGRRKADGISEPADDGPARTVRMYGPGDVSGIDTRQIVRTEPAANTTNVPPTSFPAVEFDRPDLPWLFSPERADDAGRTTPWLCLVVVADDRDDVSLVRSTDGERSVLTAPGSELPPAEETWAWAHAQVIGPGSIDDVVARDSTRTRSRLLCPRRLDPETDYIAAVVPTFEPGRLAGLGQSPYRTDETGEPTGSGEIGRAWDGTESAVELPVYHHWTFQTGPDGDFETLVDRLTPRDLPADVGIRTVDVSRPGPDSLEPGRTDGPDPDASVVDVTGALASPESQLLPESEVLASYSDTQRERLRSILNRPNAAGVDPTVPVVGPPMYGSFHADVSAVAESPQWLTGLNLEPRSRIAAGLGAAVVRENQEALMAAAWEQAGELEQLNHVLGGGQVGRAGAGRIYERLESASLSRLLQFTAPAHDQVVPDPDETATDRRTLAARIDDNDALATGVFRPTFRRVTRPKGTLGRAASITARPTAFAEDFVTGTATTDDLADRLEDRLYSVDDLADASLSPTTDGRGAPDLSSLSGTEAAFDPERAIPEVVLSRLSDATALHDRPDPLATVLWAPTFGEPLSRALADLSEEHLLPDVGDIPADTVGALATSPAFVESFLVGANHEMARSSSGAASRPTDGGRTSRRSGTAPATPSQTGPGTSARSQSGGIARLGQRSVERTP